MPAAITFISPHAVLGGAEAVLQTLVEHADPATVRGVVVLQDGPLVERLRRATGVRVELRTIGEDTEFDKAVAEQLVDPITQLLRNAVAHGVEPPDERAAKGKPQTATIKIGRAHV